MTKAEYLELQSFLQRDSAEHEESESRTEIVGEHTAVS